MLATAGDPATKNGQFVGPAVAAEVLDARPSTVIDADLFGSISPANFAHGAVAGLAAGEVGFLFKLTDSAGQVAMNSSASSRDDVSVSVATDLGKAITIAGILSNAGNTAGAQAYVNIGQELTLGTTTITRRAATPPRPAA